VSIPSLEAFAEKGVNTSSGGKPGTLNWPHQECCGAREEGPIVQVLKARVHGSTTTQHLTAINPALQSKYANEGTVRLLSGILILGSTEESALNLNLRYADTDFTVTQSKQEVRFEVLKTYTPVLHIVEAIWSRNVSFWWWIRGR
jgi:hypothetical protein